MGKREEVENMYQQLQWLLDEGEFGDPWGGNPTDDAGKVSEDVLGDFFLFLIELYTENVPELIFMFLQVYNWHYQSIHEGPMSYYENFYHVDQEDGIQRLSEGLHRHGYHELAMWYDYGIIDYKLYPDGHFPSEQYVRAKEIREWIDENPEAIWEVYVDLLLKNKEILLQDAQAAKVEEVENSAPPNRQRKQAEKHQKDEFASIIQLGETGSDSYFFGYLDFSQMDEPLALRLAEAQNVNRIQTVKDIPVQVLELLDRKVFSVRSDILFRIFRRDEKAVCDIKDFEILKHVRKLSIDSVRDVEHAEVLSRLESLEELELDLMGRKEYGFVNHLPAGITDLTIHLGQEVEECTFGSGGLYDMEWWLRLPGLRKGYVGKFIKHMELVTRGDSVREFRVMAMPCPGAEFLNQLSPGKIVVHQKRAEGVEVLGKVPMLEEVELLGMEDLQCLDFLAELPNLRKAVLRGLSEVTELPCFPKGHGLREMEVHNCEKLKDISGLRGLEYLEKLTLYFTDVSEEDVRDVTAGSSLTLRFG